MELKRIVAKDGRRATEQAIALYGPDVLVIANNSIEGQTELIVAVPTPAAPPEPAAPVAAAAANPHAEPPAGAGANANASARPVVPASALGPNDFRAFDEALQQVRNAAPEVAALSAARAPAPTTDASGASGSSAAAGFKSGLTPAADLRETELLRGREIVDLVRQDLAALRQEFKLSRQLSSWEARCPRPPALEPLAQALHDMAVPAGLRALLLDSLGEHDDAPQALQAMHALLCANLRAEPAAVPQAGVHALCGPSGSGKTVMLARLALAAAEQLAPEQVALVSFCDARPGAWSQLQLLASQAGVDCFRARDRAALELLLDELAGRRLVLIDTAGTDFDAHAQALRALSQGITLHAVLPVDASITSVRRVLQAPSRPWASLMLSKLDEAGHPWPLIQGLTEARLPLSLVGENARPTAGALPFEPARLVDLALAPLHQALAHLPADAAATGATPLVDTARVLGDRRATERTPHG